MIPVEESKNSTTPLWQIQNTSKEPRTFSAVIFGEAEIR